jgi:hypothetical protein
MPPSGFVIIKELQYVDMHYKGFSASCGAHKSEFIHAFQGITGEVEKPQGFIVSIVNKDVKVVQKGFLAVKITVKVHFSEKKGYVLEIL